MFFKIIELFGEKSSKVLRHSILDILSIKLEEYLRDNLSQGINPINLTDNLKPILAVSTKDYLMNKLSNKEFGCNDFEDDETRDFFSSFNEVEQNIWLIGAIYGIAGYDKNDNVKLEEICKYLGISKFKYAKIALSMGFRFLKTMGKGMDEIESETFDEYSPKKEKK